MHDFLLVSARISFMLSVCFPLCESPRATLSYNNSHAVDGKRFPHSLKMLPWEFCLRQEMSTFTFLAFMQECGKACS